MKIFAVLLGASLFTLSHAAPARTTLAHDVFAASIVTGVAVHGVSYLNVPANRAALVELAKSQPGLAIAAAGITVAATLKYQELIKNTAVNPFKNLYLKARAQVNTLL